MAVEAKRGCGYRKVGGLYLVGEPGGIVCDRLPFPLKVCPTCGAGFKPTRGIQWVEGAKLFGGICKALKAELEQAGVLGAFMKLTEDDIAAGVRISYPVTLHETPVKSSSPCHDSCIICGSNRLGLTGLMWVGGQYYPSPADFVAEAASLGVSRRISSLPRNLELGRTWIMLAHQKAISRPVSSKKRRDMSTLETVEHLPAIFHAFKPVRVEKIVTDLAPPEEMEKLRKQGITPVVVPHNDPDHNPGAAEGAEQGPELPIGEEHEGVETAQEG